MLTAALFTVAKIRKQCKCPVFTLHMQTDKEYVVCVYVRVYVHEGTS